MAYSPRLELVQRTSGRLSVNPISEIPFEITQPSESRSNI